MGIRVFICFRGQIVGDRLHAVPLVDPADAVLTVFLRFRGLVGRVALVVVVADISRRIWINQILR